MIRKSKRLSYDSLESRRVLASFSGTTAVDVIEIEYTAGVPTSITINGDEFANSGATLELDLPENLDPNSQDQITLSGSSFSIDLNQVDRDTEVTANSGSLMISAQSGLSLTTGDENDSLGLSFSTTSGQDPFDFGRPIDFDLAGGTDRVWVDGPFNGHWNFGFGDDRLFSNEPDLLRGLDIDFGGGRDRWIVNGDVVTVSVLTRNSAGTVLGEPAEPFVGPGYRVEGVEAVDTSGASSSIFKAKEGLYETPDGSETWRIDVFETSAVFWDQPTGDLLLLLGFNNFQGDQDPFGADGPVAAGTLAIQATNSALDASFFERVVIGGNLSFGDTTQIDHPIDISESISVSISNSQSASGQQVFVDHISDDFRSSLVVSGLTNCPVVINRYDGSQEINLMGSNSEADRFTVAANNRNVRLTLFGNGGDDVFLVGTEFGVHEEANLDWVRGSVNVVDGAGNDFLRVNDSQATANFSYRVRDNWVHNAPDPAGQAERDFIGVWHSGIERVRVDGSTGSNRFRVTPSLKTAFSIYGDVSDNDVDNNDTLLLLPPYLGTPNLIDLGPDEGAIWFGNDIDDEKLIHFLDMESTVIV